ncbi:hypothetical protein NEDG_00359 [Nematocida displodere]|uniref:Uncharacterized protein n=1 Tax=Nematocida displodere TaxID=1805483 RepID=A0A177EIT5_9MICR|nr:hypothetical protein NEDG_00359 [Nematocida displodere]
MQSFSVTELRELIGLAKTGGNMTSALETRLLGFLDNQEGIGSIFQTIEVEDALGRFYSLLLLQKGISPMQQRGSEEELDVFIEKVEHLLDVGVGTNDRMEMARVSALYSSLALLFWPVKMARFVERVSGLLSQRQRLGFEILKNFLGQVADSLEITEERRYELKKHIGAAINALFLLVLQEFSKDQCIEVLAIMCRIGIASEECLKRVFVDGFGFTEGVSELISELSLDSTSELFGAIADFLYKNYRELKQSEMEALEALVECASSFGHQSLPKCMGTGSFDLLLREILCDSIHELKDIIEGETVLAALKVYVSRAKGYLLQKNGTLTPPAQASPGMQGPGESAEDMGVVLGENPGQMLLTICSLHLSLGAASNDFIVRALDMVGTAFPVAVTEFLSAFNESIPTHACEALLKRAVAPVYLSSAYLNLRQTVIRGEYSTEAVKDVDLRTGKECAAVKDCLEGAEKQGRLDLSVVMQVYEKAIEVSGYYSLDLAVTCAVLLGRKDLVLHTMQGFEGKGVAAFVSAITKCPEIVGEVFGEFQRYFLEKEGDLTNEIDAISKVLSQGSAPSRSGSGKGSVPGIDATELLGQPIIEKIFSKIDQGTFLELKKIAKILPNLTGTIHTAFIHRIWSRIRRDSEQQLATGDYEHNADIQQLLDRVTAECVADEVSVLYEIVGQGDFPIRGMFLGIKRVLETGRESAHQMQIESAVVNMLVSIYVNNSEETVRASVVGLLTEKPERISLMESIYHVSLSEVQNVKEKRGAMKRALRRIEGMKEKQGAILPKTINKAISSEDRWTEVSTPFSQ